MNVLFKLLNGITLNYRLCYTKKSCAQVATIHQLLKLHSKYAGILKYPLISSCTSGNWPKKMPTCCE